MDINTVLPLVTESVDRDRLITFAENLFLVDGDFGTNEQVWYEKLVNVRKLPINDVAPALAKNPFSIIDDRPSTDLKPVDLSSVDVRQAMEKLLEDFLDNVT